MRDTDLKIINHVSFCFNLIRYAVAPGRMDSQSGWKAKEDRIAEARRRSAQIIDSEVREVVEKMLAIAHAELIVWKVRKGIIKSDSEEAQASTAELTRLGVTTNDTPAFPE